MHLYLAFMCCLTFIHSNHLCAQLLAGDIALSLQEELLAIIRIAPEFVKKFQCYDDGDFDVKRPLDRFCKEHLK